MGNDGGSIPHREDLIKEKPKETKFDKKLYAHTKSKLCTLTNQPLSKPIVVERIGNLFNKEAILNALITKKMSKAYCYIRKMKDVKDVNSKTKTSSSDKSDETLVCPISGKEFNGVNKFTLLWSCGCLMASGVFENMITDNTCPNCGKKFKQKDLID